MQEPGHGVGDGGATVPDAPALIHGPRNPQLAASSRTARPGSPGTSTAAGLRPDSKVALYLYNGPEYLEATFGAFKVRCRPGQRELPLPEAELTYLLDNSDAEAVVVRRRRSPTALEPSVATCRCSDAAVLRVDDGDPVAGAGRSTTTRRSDRPTRCPASTVTVDDLWFLYTGGTTGMPKGVMWPHRQPPRHQRADLHGHQGAELPTTVAEQVARRRPTFHERAKAVRLLPGGAAHARHVGDRRRRACCTPVAASPR